MTQRAQHFSWQIQDRGVPAHFLVHDRNTKFLAAFAAVFISEDVKIIRTPVRAPNANGKDERFNGTVRDECLNLYLFVSVAEAKVRVETFRQQYNTDRPHSRLGYQTPSEFKRTWISAQANGSDSNIPTGPDCGGHVIPLCRASTRLPSRSMAR